MKICNYFLVLICVCLGINSCMTEAEMRAWQEAAREYNRILDYSTIKEITTCKHGNLNEIRKNLILEGYEVENMDNQVLVTKWKQTQTLDDGTVYFHKMSFIKVAPDSIKFRKKYKDEYPYQEKDTKVNTIKDASYEQRLENQRQACKTKPNSDECRKKIVRKDTTSETVSYRTTFRTREYEPIYYARYLNSFKSERDKFCGPEPVEKIDNTKGKNTNNKK